MLTVILLDSIFVTSNKEYYAQILLKECKYAIIKIVNIINKDLELSKSDDELIIIPYFEKSLCIYVFKTSNIKIVW